MLCVCGGGGGDAAKATSKWCHDCSYREKERAVAISFTSTMYLIHSRVMQNMKAFGKQVRIQRGKRIKEIILQLDRQK